MMDRKDWLDFADIELVRAEYAAGPQDLTEVAPGQWGMRGVGIVCLGDRAHMRKVQENLFDVKFHGGPCHFGYYGPDHGGDALPTVAERILA